MKYHVMQDPNRPDQINALVVVDDNGLEFARMQGPMSMTLAGLLLEYLDNSKGEIIAKYIQIANSRWMK